MRYVVAHITEGQPGRPETKIYADIPTIEDYFTARLYGLTSATYATDMQYQVPEGASLRKLSVGVFPTIGIPYPQVGVEFDLSVAFHITVDYVS